MEFPVLPNLSITLVYLFVEQFMCGWKSENIGLCFRYGIKAEPLFKRICSLFLTGIIVFLLKAEVTSLSLKSN